MTDRLNPYAAAPKLMQAWIEAATAVTKDGLEHSLKELVKIRASQMNGCARCLDMHVREARHAGETEARLYMLPAWRESDLYSPREKAALAWTEALVRLSETHAPDADYALMAEHFSAEEQAHLTMVIGVIHAFNMFGAGFRAPPFKTLPRAA